MNFLQLCQRLRSECGLSGTGPATVLGQTGENLRLVNWINAAWMDIQAAHTDWNWLRTSLTPFATTEGKATYAPVADLALSDFGEWARESFRVYNTAAGINSEIPLIYMSYERWRNTYQMGAMRSSTSHPRHVTVTPDESLGFGPVTAAGHTIVGDYFKAPSEMSADDDVPILPAKFHLAIVYRAMMFYGGYDAASETYQRGEFEFKKKKRLMEAEYLPDVGLGGSLA